MAENEKGKPESRKANPTSYLVLRRTAEGYWNEAGKATASSATAARRQIAEKLDETEVTLVAVPTRSWKPVTRKVEQQPKITEVPAKPIAAKLAAA